MFAGYDQCPQCLRLGIGRVASDRENAAMTCRLSPLHALPACLACVLFACSAHPQVKEITPRKAQAVMVGGKNGPACDRPAFVLPSENNPRDDVPVYSTPERSQSPVDWVKPGYVVSVCEEAMDGTVKGIVYNTPQFFGPDQAEPIDPDCGVGRVIAEAKPYDGDCASGWVESAYLWVGDN